MQAAVDLVVEVVFLALCSVLDALLPLFELVDESVLLRLAPAVERLPVLVADARARRLHSHPKRLYSIQLQAILRLILPRRAADFVIAATRRRTLISAVVELERVGLGPILFCFSLHGAIRGLQRGRRAHLRLLIDSSLHQRLRVVL